MDLREVGEAILRKACRAFLEIPFLELWCFQMYLSFNCQQFRNYSFWPSWKIVRVCQTVKGGSVCPSVGMGQSRHGNKTKTFFPGGYVREVSKFARWWWPLLNFFFFFFFFSFLIREIRKRSFSTFHSSIEFTMHFQSAVLVTLTWFQNYREVFQSLHGDDLHWVCNTLS